MTVINIHTAKDRHCRAEFEHNPLPEKKNRNVGIIEE